MKYTVLSMFGLGITTLFFSCASKQENTQHDPSEQKEVSHPLAEKLAEYKSIQLSADLSSLTENERQIIALMIKAGDLADQIFWKQAYPGDKQALFQGLDSTTAAFVNIQYGPWDRLDNNTAFVEGVGEKPLGAGFYPVDMTKEAFEAWQEKAKYLPYSIVRRNQSAELQLVRYSEAYKEEITQMANLLNQAADLADDKGLKKYLSQRAKDLLADDYFLSDMAWMDMKTNTLDIVIGPIENYEDKLFGIRSAFECYILVKDKVWSEKLAKFAALLPELQKNLPVEAKYKSEKVGADSDLNAYEVLYYKGDCNAGSKTIAINLPNDERIQLKKGSRRLQLKNAMRAKFDAILVPIADLLIDESQRKHITFDAFFSNVMFHEVAHGLGIKNVVGNPKQTVKDALKELNSALEEGKADILGLYMITQLHQMGHIEGNLMDYYTTFMAGIFRSVRFGAASAHGKANMICFNYFSNQGAFVRDGQTGKYRVDFEKMQAAIAGLSAQILMLQGDGDYEKVKNYNAEMAAIGQLLKEDLEKIKAQKIPRDIVFEQGAHILGLQ